MSLGQWTVSRRGPEASGRQESCSGERTGVDYSFGNLELRAVRMDDRFQTSVLSQKNKDRSSALGDIGRKKVLMRDAGSAIEDRCRETTVRYSQRSQQERQVKKIQD